ncbi:basic proline-rich protein-like [Choloepus didactylus]|uniref:basic proline-rich protein-like n=1 Tax=Choloepus didactylus TaxID=27675 RepID=UPI0018A102F5|nr:basic proline-rich protein-like [Choloepus didactylus]
MGALRAPTPGSPSGCSAQAWPQPPPTPRRPRPSGRAADWGSGAAPSPGVETRGPLEEGAPGPQCPPAPPLPGPSLFTVWAAPKSREAQPSRLPGSPRPPSKAVNPLPSGLHPVGLLDPGAFLRALPRVQDPRDVRAVSSYAQCPHPFLQEAFKVPSGVPQSEELGLGQKAGGPCLVIAGEIYAQKSGDGPHPSWG